MEQSALNVATSQQMDGSYLLEKKIEIMISTAAKKILSEIAGIKGAILTLQNEISEVKRARVQSASASAPPSYSSAANIPSNTNSNNHPSSTVARPRFGDYKPEDVSVDKFFYFGTNKSK